MLHCKHYWLLIKHWAKNIDKGAQEFDTLLNYLFHQGVFVRQFNPLLLKYLENFDGQLHEVFVDTSSLSILAVLFQEDIEELGIVPRNLLHINKCQSDYISSEFV